LLAYLAKTDELIVIDEPEMNLHPEAQVKMIEFIAMLVNSGLNNLITTHSPYLVDHLTNLIKATEVEDKESIRSEFYLKRTDAFLAKDKASVYLFEHGHTTQAMDEDGVIQLNTFGEVSDRISELYFKL
jgi:predicted ATPase